MLRKLSQREIFHKLSFTLQFNINYRANIINYYAKYEVT